MDPALLNLKIRRGLTWPGFAITCRDANGAAVPLAGWTAYGQIRTKAEGGTLVYDLAPVIAADDADGLITIPEIPHDVTRTLPAGDFVYDVIPEDPLGRRLDPIVAGQIKSSISVTQIP